MPTSSLPTPETKIPSGSLPPDGPSNHRVTPRSLGEKGQYLLSRLGGVSLILGTAAGVQFGIGWWIAQHLSDPAHVGLFWTFVSLTTTLSTLGVCGTINGWAAWLSRPDTANQDWKRHLYRRSKWMIPMTLGAWIVATLILQLGPFSGGLCLIATLGFQVKELFSVGLLRARGHYRRAAWGQKLWFFLTASLLLLTHLVTELTLDLALGIVGVSLITNAIIAVIWARRLSPPESKRHEVPIAADRIAWSYWPIGISLVVSRHADRLVLSSYGLLSETGSYGTIMAFLGGYELAIAASGFVLLPYFQRIERVPLGRTTQWMLGVCFLLGAFYVLIGPVLFGWLFQGRFDDGLDVLPILVLAGSVRFLGVLPGSLIGARLGPDSLRLFSRGSVLLAPVSVSMTLMLVPWSPLIGAGLAVLITETLRSLLAWWALWRHHSQLRPPPSSSS